MLCRAERLAGDDEKRGKAFGRLEHDMPSGAAVDRAELDVAHVPSGAFSLPPEVRMSSSRLGTSARCTVVKDSGSIATCSIAWRA